MVDEWDREALLAPIGEQECGEDLSFSALFDQLKEARRADPTYLSQGDWEVELKRADWNQVVALASQALADQSKDLMLAAWLCEGLAHRDHFTGLAYGLGITAALCERYWALLYPPLDDELDQRLARFSWLDATLGAVVGSLPLTQGQGYGLDHYQESREVENRARHDAEAMRLALHEGKINVEIFQRSVLLTETEFLRARHGEVDSCRQILCTLGETLERYLGDQTPRFSRLSGTLDEACRLIERLLTERGVELATARVGTEAQPPSMAPATAPLAAAAATPSAALRTVPQSRDEAFDMLNGVAQFFKGSEPHSPVPYLVERAVRWGRMPLEEWLRDVIRDDQVIDGIRETLGTQRHDQD